MTEDSRPLADVLSRAREEERIRAARALLLHPLMTMSDPELATVRRHAEVLRTWFARETGWVLQVERDCARLYKRPGDLRDETRGAPGFNRRRYVLFCLACAALERADPQITLKNLGERLLELAWDPDLAARGFSFTLESQAERRELVHICRSLLSLGVLQRVAGDEEAYVQHTGDALYDVQRRVLAMLLAAARGPSTYPPEAAPADTEARVAALAEEFVPDSTEGRRTALRHQLARRLLDDPVTYCDELHDFSRDYFLNQRGAMSARLCEATGLKAEQRSEGTALVDPDGELTDEALPAEGTLHHVTLLLAQHLAERARAGAEQGMAASEVAVFVREACDKYGRYWRKSAREPGAEAELASDALARLVALKLVYRQGNVVRARPALLRYAVGAAQVVQSTLSLS